MPPSPASATCSISSIHFKPSYIRLSADLTIDTTRYPSSSRTCHQSNDTGHHKSRVVECQNRSWHLSWHLSAIIAQRTAKALPALGIHQRATVLWPQCHGPLIQPPGQGSPVITLW